MTAVASKRSQPANLEAERSILGGILVTQGRALDAVGDALTAEDFLTDAHQAIFRTMVELAKDGHPIDLITVKDALQRSGHLVGVGGPAYISSLTDGMPTSVNVGYYARVVREDGCRRRIITLANALLDQAYAADETPGDLVDAAERGLLEVSQRAVPGEPTTSAALAHEMFDVIDQVTTQRRPLTGLDTGLPSVNRATRGLQPGSLVLLAGRPGTGKSALAMQMALHASQVEPVLFFSLEMSNREQGFRAASMLGRVDSHRLQSGHINETEQRQVQRALESLSTRHLLFDDTGSLTVLQVRSRARRQKARGGLGLLVLDYLQLLTHTKADRSESREQAVAGTSRAMKQLARELNIPCLVLCQLSRQAEATKDQRPMLSHLRESGSLEQDADLVMLIHKPPAQSNGAVSSSPGVQLLIAKNRNGPLDEIDLAWSGEYYRFAEVEGWRAS